MLEKIEPRTRSYQILCRRFGKTDYRSCWRCNDYEKLRLISLFHDLSEMELNNLFYDLLELSVQSCDESMLWNEIRCNRLLCMWTAWEGPMQFDPSYSQERVLPGESKVLNLGSFPEITAHVISTTHWDPEVHQPSSVMLIRLASVIEDLRLFLETPNSPPFLMDGQVSPIFDFLELFPEKKEAIDNLVVNKKLIIGPWWVVPDTFHPSGECLIRNLLLGIKYSSSLGNVLRAGYTPDPFGMAAQFPQILSGFNIGSCFTRRGIGNEITKNEFTWSSPNGSTILGINLRWGYRTIGLLPRDFNVVSSVVANIVQEMSKTTTSRNILLISGDNNLGVQKDLQKLIDNLNQSFRNVVFKFSDPLDFVKAVEKENLTTENIEGELIGGRFQMHLTGCASSRIPMKQLARKASAIIESKAEYLSSFAWVIGYSYPKTFLNKAWELIIRNSFHDSISGTHVDPVDQTIINRYSNSIDISNTISEQSITHILSQIKCDSNNSLIIFDSVSLTTPIPLEIFLPRNFPKISHFTQNNGVDLPIQVTNKTENKGIILYSNNSKGKKVIGLKSFKPSISPENNRMKSVILSNNCIETSKTKVNILENGTFEIRNKSTEEVIIAGILNSSGDKGDLFRSQLLETNIASGYSSFRVSIIEKGPVRFSFLISGIIMVPQGLTKDRLQRSKRLVKIPIRTKISIYDESPIIDIQIQVNNKAKDHLLQYGFAFQSLAKSVISSQPFHLNSIDILEKKNYVDWIEQPNAGRFTSGIISVGNWTFISPDITEFIPKNDLGITRIDLSLIRGVGIHGLKSMPDRLWNAGMPIPVPDAQCLGKQEYKIRIMPDYCENAEKWDLLNSLQYGLSTFIIDSQNGNRDSNTSLIELSPRDLVISAIKCSETGNELIVRLFNPSSKKIESASLEVSFGILAAWSVNLEENKLEQLPIINGKTIKFEINPLTIFSLCIIPISHGGIY